MNHRKAFRPSRRGLAWCRLKISTCALVQACFAAVVLPVASRANVNVNGVLMVVIAQAAANDFTQPPQIPDYVGEGYTTLGDFSGTFRAYQERDNGSLSEPELVAAAEAKIDYTMHASSHRFSATLNQHTSLISGAGLAYTWAQSSLLYTASFEITRPTQYRALSSYAPVYKGAGADFQLQNTDTRDTVFETKRGLDYVELDLAGWLQPGNYALYYYGLMSASIGGHLAFNETTGPASFEFTLDSRTEPPATVPDAGTTLAFLGFALAGLIATAKLPRVMSGLKSR